MPKDNSNTLIEYQRLIKNVIPVNDVSTLKQLWLEAIERGRHQPTSLKRDIGQLAAKIPHSSELDAIRSYDSDFNTCWNMLETFFSTPSDSEQLWANLAQSINNINSKILDDRIRNIYKKNQLPKHTATKIVKSFQEHRN